MGISKTEDTPLFYSSARQRVAQFQIETSRSDRLVRAKKQKIRPRKSGRNGREPLRGQCEAGGRCKTRSLHSSASHNECGRGVGFRARFFCLRTRAGFVARADAYSTSSTRSAWRYHVPRIWNRSMRPCRKNCQEKNTKYRRKKISRSICSGVVSGHTVSKSIRVWQ
jgi:hypothetical protein